MKVILLTDIPKVGKKYEVKEFKEGYAQNVLLSKGLAELATPQALSRLAEKKAKMEKDKANEMQVFADLIDKVSNLDIKIPAKANEKGHLFKSINTSDVVKAIKDTSGIKIDESSLVVPHIKELGEYMIVIKKGSKEGTFKIKVEK